jgi:MYXO-CTERM domain-containing protein
MSASLAVLVGCALSFTGCTMDIDETEFDDVGAESQDIINGALDTTRHGVVAVLANGSACTGTIIHTDPAQGVGHVLTAAHCGAPIEVRQGNNYLNPTAAYTVIDWANHPSYDSQALLFDFKMVRIVGVSGSTPVIPAMTPAQDNLGGGTQVRHVGYGKSGPAPGSDNTQRRQILGSLSGVSSTQITYNQPSGGPCSGDSGGPQLTVGGTERIVGVTSYGDQNCASSGVSGRVSGVYDTFIVPYINNAPTGPLTCDQCTQSATSGQGACSSQVNACFNNSECSALLDCFNNCGNNQSCLQGCVNQYPNGYNMYVGIFDCVCDTACPVECGNEAFCTQGGGSSSAVASASASSAASVGAGGSGAGAGDPTGGAGADAPVGAGAGAGTPGDGWNAGNAGEEDYDGRIQISSGCSTGSSHDPGNTQWLWALALAGAAAVRRRRRG